MSRTDVKAQKTIPLLLKRRAEGRTMGYGELGAEIGHPERFLGNVLDRVGAWCEVKGKQSLALLVVDTDGKPRRGMYKSLGLSDPLTPENYESRRAALFDEDWADVTIPDESEIAEAYRQLKL